MRRELDRALAGSGLSGAQYHVLRILRGAGADGLPTLGVRDGLVDAAPGITRLLEKLTRAGFVIRVRATTDRRQVICRLTPAGIAAVDAVEPRVHAAFEQLGARLTGAEQADCVRLLRALRSGRHREAPQSSRQRGR